MEKKKQTATIDLQGSGRLATTLQQFMNKTELRNGLLQ
jgi:hypothetical protein